MRLVSKPAFRPQQCAAIPFIGPAGHPDERWVDTGAEMPGFDNHVYLSETAVAEAARLLGHPTPAAHAALGAELVTALTDLQAALDEVAALSKYKAAVDEIRAGAAA